MPKRLCLDDKKIISMYVDNMLSSDEIGSILGVSKATIIRRLHENNIVCRDHLERCSLKGGVVPGETTYRNYDWIYRQYHTLEKSLTQIEEDIGVDRHTIARWMKRLGVAQRTRIESALLLVNHFTKNEDFEHFINGLLLGDGRLSSLSPISAIYTHGSSYFNYIEGLKKRFISFGIDSPAKTHIKNGETKGHKFIGYSFATLSYYELLPIQKKWYGSGIKAVPRDIDLNPTTCLHWYLGDGGLRHNKKGRASIKMSTHGFAKDDVLWLIDELKKRGFASSYWPSCNCIGISTASTPKFLEYIGPCPRDAIDYGYRWDLDLSKKQWEAELCQIAA